MGWLFIDGEGRFLEDSLVMWMLECLTDLKRNLTVLCLPSQTPLWFLTAVGVCCHGKGKREKRKGSGSQLLQQDGDGRNTQNSAITAIMCILGVQSWLTRSLITDTYRYNFHLNYPMSPCRSTQEKLAHEIDLFKHDNKRLPTYLFPKPSH